MILPILRMIGLSAILPLTVGYYTVNSLLKYRHLK